MLAGQGTPYASGLSPQGRLVAASGQRVTFYGHPLVAWAPVQGAAGYELQWSHSRIEWRANGVDRDRGHGRRAARSSPASGGTGCARATRTSRASSSGWPGRRRTGSSSPSRDSQSSAASSRFPSSDDGRVRPRMGPDLSFALELADAADAISLPRFRARDLVVETKPDLTPVTEADRARRARARARLAGRAPPGRRRARRGARRERRRRSRRAGSSTRSTARRNYARGIPVWATLIALEADGELTVGVVSAPALGRRWWAARGEGAWRETARRLACLGGRAARGRERAARALDSACRRRVAGAWHLRGFGDFWPHMLVAEGAVDVAVDAVGARSGISPRRS